jgi:hypothetical protein
MEQFILVLAGICLFLAMSAIVGYIALGIYIAKEYLGIGDKRQSPPKPHKPLFKPKEPKETEEEKRLRILSENIENYDGSAKGQIKL